MRYAILMPLVFVTLFVNAQDDVLDSAVMAFNEPGKPFPPRKVREADVLWSTRIWRVIDLGEKQNLPLRHPVESLAEILHETAKTGEFKTYSPIPSDAYDLTGRPLTEGELDSVGLRCQVFEFIDPLSFATYWDTICDALTYDKIIKFKLMEEWYFDENTSSMHVHILSIAPVMNSYDSQGNLLGEETLYWMSYSDLIPILALFKPYNSGNTNGVYSWYDYFEMRLFSSYIYKESNVHDRAIADYAVGVDALLESDRIEQELFQFEHDLWTY